MLPDCVAGMNTQVDSIRPMAGMKNDLRDLARRGAYELSRAPL